MASTQTKTKNLLPLSSLLLLLLHLPFSAAQITAIKGGYWLPDSGISASNIDSTLFTHLFFAFAYLNPQPNYEIFIPSSNTAAFTQFTSTVRVRNPSVQTMLSIGGGNATMTDLITTMAASPAFRSSFISSSIKLARDNGFSGLDLDWEYPTTSTYMTNLGSLLTEWRQAINAEATSSGRAALLLTAAVSYSVNVNGVSNPVVNYPVQVINSNMDWINAMAYDFHNPSRKQDSSATNAHAMLYNPANKGLSGDSGIAQWIGAGLDKTKLALGMPFYGFAWTLANPNNNGMLAPAVGPAGSGAMTYTQILDFITRNGAHVVYNSTIVANYCYSGTTWIGYDDKDAIAAKVSYAKEKGLRGYFAWHVGQDSNAALATQASQSWGT